VLPLVRYTFVVNKILLGFMVLCRFVAGYGYLTLPSDVMASERFMTYATSEIFYGFCYILVGLGIAFFQRHFDVSPGTRKAMSICSALMFILMHLSLAMATRIQTHSRKNSLGKCECFAAGGPSNPGRQIHFLILSDTPFACPVSLSCGRIRSVNFDCCDESKRRIGFDDRHMADCCDWPAILSNSGSPNVL
jgi:hypothetical protein